MPDLTEEQVNELSLKHGGGFCHCIEAAASEITCAMLAEYCVLRGFKPFPEPVKEAQATRYAYLMEDKGVRAKQVASFTDLPHSPLRSAETVIVAIRAIARFDNVMPVQIADDILETVKPAKQEAPKQAKKK